MAFSSHEMRLSTKEMVFSSYKMRLSTKAIAFSNLQTPTSDKEMVTFNDFNGSINILMIPVHFSNEKIQQQLFLCNRTFQKRIYITS